MMDFGTVLNSIGRKLPLGVRDDGEKSAETRNRVVFDEDLLLSDEERLLEAMYDAHGRVWQSMLCEELDWEKSKVSRLLTQLEGDGKISKYHVGRQNAVCLPEYEPDPAHIEPSEWTEDNN